MFDPTSRYFNLEQVSLQVVASDGTTRELKYARRRFVQSGATVTTLVEHTVADDERIDNITARYIGDPMQFWRLCDTNGAMRPSDLTDEIGRVLKIGFTLR